MNEPGIILFTRYPVEHRVKTRLVGTIGSVRATLLQRRMSEYAADIARQALTARQVTICYTGAERERMCSWLGEDFVYREQRGPDLGERMRYAFHEAFLAGAGPVVVIGSDVPSLRVEIVRNALESLRTREIVLGPACDGGYYLIGMRRLYPELFSGVDWGSRFVCEQTLGRIRELGLEFVLLEQLRDIDTPEDLRTIRDDERFADVFSNESPDTTNEKE